MIIFEGVPTGTRIGHENTILSNAGNTVERVILIDFTLVISTGGVKLQTGVLQLGGFTEGVKST
jgi:hypothetical protein